MRACVRVRVQRWRDAQPPVFVVCYRTHERPADDQLLVQLRRLCSAERSLQTGSQRRRLLSPLDCRRRPFSRQPSAGRDVADRGRQRRKVHTVPPTTTS